MDLRSTWDGSLRAPSRGTQPRGTVCSAMSGSSSTATAVHGWDGCPGASTPPTTWRRRCCLAVLSALPRYATRAPVRGVRLRHRGPQGRRRAARRGAGGGARPRAPETADGGLGPEEHAVRNSEAAIARRLLDLLPDHQRELLLLRVAVGTVRRGDRRRAGHDLRRRARRPAPRPRPAAGPRCSGGRVMTGIVRAGRRRRGPRRRGSRRRADRPAGRPGAAGRRRRRRRACSASLAAEVDDGLDDVCSPSSRRHCSSQDDSTPASVRRPGAGRHGLRATHRRDRGRRDPVRQRCRGSRDR